MASQYKNHAAVWTTSIEQIQYQKRRHFWAIPRKITLVYLYSLWLRLCFVEQLQTFRHKSDAM